VSRFLAIRQYTKIQVLTVSLVCLLLGLLLPLEKVFLLASGGASNFGTGAASMTTRAQFKSGLIGRTNLHHQKAGDGGFPSSASPSSASSSDSDSFDATLPILVAAQAAAVAKAAAAARKPVVDTVVVPPAPAVVEPLVNGEDRNAAATTVESRFFQEVLPIADGEGAI